MRESILTEAGVLRRHELGRHELLSESRFADSRSADHQHPVDGRVDRLAAAACLPRRVVARSAGPGARVVRGAGRRQHHVALVDEAALRRDGEGPASECGSHRRDARRRPRSLG